MARRAPEDDPRRRADYLLPDPDGSIAASDIKPARSQATPPRAWVISEADEHAVGNALHGESAQEAVKRHGVTREVRANGPWQAYLEDVDHPHGNRTVHGSFGDVIDEARNFGADTVYVWSPTEGHVPATTDTARILD